MQNEIHSEMRPVYGDKCFTRPAIHVWCTKFVRGRESIVDKERPGRHVVATPMSRLPQFFASGIQKLVDNGMGQMSERT